MNTVYHKALIAIATIASFICVASEPRAGVSENNLRVFFNSIVRDGTNYVFAVKSGFVSIIKGEDGKKVYRACKDGDLVTLPHKSSLTLFERHLSLTITPIDGNTEHKEFRVSYKTDFGAMDGVVSTNFAYLISTDNNSVPRKESKGSSGQKAERETKSTLPDMSNASENMFLKGLRLLPCD